MFLDMENLKNYIYQKLKICVDSSTLSFYELMKLRLSCNSGQENFIIDGSNLFWILLILEFSCQIIFLVYG